MNNFILVLIANVLIFWIAIVGNNYFDRQDQKQKSRERAKGRFRWSNGQFSRVKTYADLRKEVNKL